MDGAMVPVIRILAVSVAMVAGAGLSAAAGAEARHGRVAMTCTNPASGASWRINIDYDKRAVDSNPAHIKSDEVAWTDAADNGSYSLELSSGKLTIVIPSSTGGYFLHDVCKAEPSG